MKIFLIFFIFTSISVQAMFVGNLSDPCMFNNGIFFTKNRYASLRGSYVFYDLYKGRFKDQFNFIIPNIENNFYDSRDDIKMRLNAGMLIINLQKRFDLYGFLGTADLQINGQFFSKNALAKGLGLKAVLFKWQHVNIALDGKYFRTKPEFSYVVVENHLYPIIATDTTGSKYSEKYQEWQAALGISYLTSFIIPYVGATFLYALRSPSSPVFFIDLSDSDPGDVDSKSSVSSRNWGIFLGASLLAQKKMSLNIETRLFDQNSFSVIGEIRF